MAEDPRVARHLLVTGRVQGVWYRGWTERHARSLKLDGWVRNRADGSVQVLLAGPESAVAEMASLCGRGPSAAIVDHIEQSEAEDPGTTGFAQRPTV